MPGPERTFTTENVLDYLKNGGRPAYSVADVVDALGATRPTAQARLDELEAGGDVVHIKIGSAKAYFVPGENGAPETPLPPDIDREEYHRRSLLNWVEDRFVGLQSQPWTATHPNDGTTEGGDTLQLQVRGTPGNWSVFRQYAGENRRPHLDEAELEPSITQALITGKLYEKPTTPIEHVDYPDDYDLELNIGAEVKGDPPNQAVVALGVKNYLIRPANDAVFFTDGTIDWISVEDEDADPPEIASFGYEDIEDPESWVEEWREENFTENGEWRGTDE